jgi:hypothetical protein
MLHPAHAIGRSLAITEVTCLDGGRLPIEYSYLGIRAERISRQPCRLNGDEIGEENHTVGFLDMESNHLNRESSS